MFQELECYHVQKREKRFLILKKNSYRIGKSLDNDIVLLDSEASPYLATLQKSGASYLWLQGNDSINLTQFAHQTDGFIFSLRNRKKWVPATCFLTVFWLSLIFFQFMYRQENNLSKIVTLPARGSYGNTNPNDLISNISFEFQPTKNKFIILHYTPGNIVKMDDLEVSVNGTFLTFAPISPGRWNVEVNKYIPSNLLKDEKNLLEFVFHGKESQRWAIKDIYVEELDEMPIVTTEDDDFKTIQKLLRERSVRKGNLVRAQQVAQLALESYRQKNQEPPLRLLKFSTQIQKEKDEMIQNHESLIQKYRRENENKKSKIIYQKLMEELIDPMDPDRIRLEHEVR